ncbi:hypothetical protein WICMUC_002549 [Wickerhamomyces mucosus]|uniref:Uncharacterized protein n=1 Tax=Wickerhamomyces mucosus TaxID=1378264 RepID=A0A9P8PP00_9ASCO|nr:hypothetical protein WICMUC_002549 [Wickerhamomyces mucosus]
MAGHEVDIPITDLDDNEDDIFMGRTEELDPGVLRDDFNLDNDKQKILFGEDTIFSKILSKLRNLTSSNYSRLATNHSVNGIELRDTTYGDIDSFDLSDDEFLSRRKFQLNDNSWKKSLINFIKYYLVYVSLAVLLVIVIVLAALLGKKSSESEIEPPLKEKYSNGTDLFHPTTILISLDGFHPHYISENLTPTLYDFLVKGYGAPYMIPSFPSSTFPNHWTIATGLYPDSHGIVGNTFFDTKLNKQFVNVLPEHSLDPEFWGGEPIWSTAESQGVRTAIHMFPGSEVIFPKNNPTEVDKYNGTETLEVKSDRILGWLDRDIKDRPELIIAYVPTIDSLGHEFGIAGKEIEEGLNYVDSFIASLTEGLQERNITDLVNLFIVSDHGMAPTSNDRLIYLDEVVNITKIKKTDGWPLFGLSPFPEFSVEEVFNELSSNYKEGDKYKIYLREDLPEEWNFGKNELYIDRIAPIWVIPDVGYSITTHSDMERKGGNYTPKGVHGYNNTEVLMRAIFLGNGPFFKSKSNAEFKIKPFHNVEIYSILCEALNLKPSNNNGTSNLISSLNMLPKDWTDSLNYPDVDFEIDTLISQDSAYDMLFRNNIKATTTLESSIPTKVWDIGLGQDENFNNPESDSFKYNDGLSPQDTAERPKEGNQKGFFESLGEEGDAILEDIEDIFEDTVEDAKDAIDTFKDTINEAIGNSFDDDGEEETDRAKNDDKI